MKNTLRFRFLAYLLLVPILFSSCKKKVIEILPVITLVKDMSIENADDIKFFDFQSSQVGYAASESTFIYKTIDGGSSWVQQEVVSPSSSKTCKGLVFFDENTGLCLMNTDLYRTTNGGDDWFLNQTGVKFLEITDSDAAVTGKCAPNLLSIDIYVSTNEGASFGYVGNIQPFNTLNACNELSFSSCHNNQLILSFEDDDALPGIDLLTGVNFTITPDDMTAFERPRAFYTNGNFGVLVGERGVLQSDFNAGFYLRKYYGHAYTYNAVDGYGDLVICAGEKTITTNLSINDEEWNEVFDSNGNGFTSTFHKVSFIDASTFYISGSNGLIQKFSI